MKLRAIKSLSVCLILECLLLQCTESTTDFSSRWEGDRVWIGPEYWANPLQDWRVEGEEIVSLAARNRTLHLLTHQVNGTKGQMEMSVLVRFQEGPVSPESCTGGFRIGLKGEMDDYRHALVLATRWLDAGIRGDGILVLGDEVLQTELDPNVWIRLGIVVEFRDEIAFVELKASDADGDKSAAITIEVSAGQLKGNLALLANGPGAKADRNSVSSWRFREWNLKGSAIAENPDQLFGPILWTQYTLSRNTLRLLAMMAPVEGTSEKVRLELKLENRWVEVDEAGVDPLARTAIFTIENWDDSREVPYRIVYGWEGKDRTWSGTIRQDPKDRESVSMAAFSCDKGYVFPSSRIVRNVSIQDPDLLFFAGDQIYESHGGFGTTRSPVEISMLDYLRKYWMFGWTWRELLKDRPSIIIPDDHDVFQGNLWGQGGRRIPELSAKPSGADFPKGGYAMDPAWVNAVEKTQTGSLPDPVDPQPIEQGIGVYFTEMEWGGLGFAILEDRKFKTGPGTSGSQSLPAEGERELLGPRQEAFLETWISKNGSDLKLVLSQTIFCKVTTHAGYQLNRSRSGTDPNGWPKEKRDKALRILQGKPVIMVHGDQHIGALVHHGVDDWEDGAIAFMVPGSANGFPRAWWPEKPGLNRKPGEPSWTGRYFDGLDNRMTVLAVANPEEGSNLIKKGTLDPETIAHKKGSGHGIMRYNRVTSEVTFEMWRLQFDAEDPQPEDQFVGFPKTIKLDN